IYINERGEISEGTITNIFIQMDKNWYTPPVESGILNGCYREFLLNNQTDHSEMIITEELILNADKIKLTNSLRKEIRVSELWFNDEKIISFS
ncbi:aminotransferase class IV, partial [Bacteroidota bacterium]